MEAPARCGFPAESIGELSCGDIPCSPTMNGAAAEEMGNVLLLKCLKTMANRGLKREGQAAE